MYKGDLMNDGSDDIDELDIDTLVSSLNEIAEKKNNKLAQIDHLYEKTLTIASPRITKNKAMQLQLIPSSPMLQQFSLISSPSSTITDTSSEGVRIWLDDLISQVELTEINTDQSTANRYEAATNEINITDDCNVDSNRYYKLQYESLLIYVKKLQNKQKMQENKIKELKYECGYALQAFDMVAAEYSIFQNEQHVCKGLIETNEQFSNKIIELVKENRKLKEEKEELIGIINEGIVIEEANVSTPIKNELNKRLKKQVKDKLASFNLKKKKMLMQK